MANFLHVSLQPIEAFEGNDDWMNWPTVQIHTGTNVVEILPGEDFANYCARHPDVSRAVAAQCAHDYFENGTIANVDYVIASFGIQVTQTAPGSYLEKTRQVFPTAKKPSKPKYVRPLEGEKRPRVVHRDPAARRYQNRMAQRKRRAKLKERRELLDSSPSSLTFINAPKLDRQSR